MKTTIKTLILVAVLTSINFYGQKRDLDNYRLPDKRGLHDFEAPKDTLTSPFDQVYVRMGGHLHCSFKACLMKTQVLLLLKK